MITVYNELEPYPCEWLRDLITAGHIAHGEVDERSIRELTAADVRDATQFHAFAGIGVWSYALRLAGWSDSTPVWTGSCPCQPFSIAGARRGTDDERHLWPVWRDLIAECRPATIFGEQVASPDGRVWLAAVRADLEALGYEVGAADLCAASVGAPHIRQRIFFGARLANAADARLGDGVRGARKDENQRVEPERLRDDGRLADSNSEGPQGQSRGQRRSGQQSAGQDGMAGWMGDTNSEHAGRNAGAGGGTRGQGSGERQATGGVGDMPGSPGADGGLGDTTSGRLGGQRVHLRPRQQEQAMPETYWNGADYLPCSDGKARPVEPGTFPLAPRSANHVGRLRAYGNAIVPQVAATFVRAFIEAT